MRLFFAIMLLVGLSLGIAPSAMAHDGGHTQAATTQSQQDCAKVLPLNGKVQIHTKASKSSDDCCERNHATSCCSGSGCAVSGMLGAVGHTGVAIIEPGNSFLDATANYASIRLSGPHEPPRLS